MRIKVAFGQAAGKELVAKNLQTARLRDVRDFQRESGMKLEEIKAEVELSDGAALGTAIAGYLSLRNAGFVHSWDDIQNRAQGDFELIPDEQDLALAAEQKQEDAAEDADPQPARTDSRSGEPELEPANEPNAAILP